MNAQIMSGPVADHPGPRHTAPVARAHTASRAQGAHHRDTDGKPFVEPLYLPKRQGDQP
jgi:hypothetical protein